MIRPSALVRCMLEPKKHLWIDVFWIRETPKAVLVIFDGRKAWIPKVWIVRTKRGRGRSIRIKISDYHWANKVK